MTIFVFYVTTKIPNIEYVEVYGGLQALASISSFFPLNFPSNAVRIMSGDRFVSSQVMTIFIKTHFYKLRRTHRRAVVAVVVAAARGR